LGFEPDGARQFFQESVTRIVLVDTLDDPASQNELRELAEFLGMPAEVAACGVDLFAALLGTIVESWRWRCERRELETIQAAANRRLGDYGLVHDTLGRLVTIQSETELVAVMFELFSMLFAPESIVYRPVHRGERGEAVRWPEDAPADDGESAEFVVSGEESASIGSNTGLALRFCHMAETLAVVELRQVACPQYQEHYLALGVTLAQLCGLAVANARNYQALQHLAGTDELTGLSNRRRFFALAQHQFMLARRHAYRLCVIMFDIDHFKKVNDTYGHAMGDRVLRKVARTCEGSVRATDLMGRYGGEEFVVLLHETDAAGARVAAERMRASVEALVFETPQGTLRVTISLGVAESAPGRELDAEIARADAALYQAKGQGRNRLCCAESWADPL
jgi:diguanylate cyclase (GGDEF)-like protein